jgi:HAD superfamily hydrolase (TIGR01509 family)
MTIRCVLLDFGNVIAFFDHRKACQQLARLSSAGFDADAIYHTIFEDGLERGYDTGQLTTVEFIDRLRRAFALEASDAEIASAWSDIFTPNPAMTETILALKARGVRLVLASNTNALHHDWFARVFREPLSALDAQVLSYQVGSRKPEHPFFAACLDAAHCRAGECLYVDDRQDFVDVGRELGLCGLVYTPEVDVLGAMCY